MEGLVVTVTGHTCCFLRKSNSGNERSKLSKRYLFQEETCPINKDSPTVHTLGHDSLVTIQKRILPELQWHTLTAPDIPHCLSPLHKMVPNS